MHTVVLAIGSMRWINDTVVSYFPYAVSSVACYRHTMRHYFLTHMLDTSRENQHSTCTHTNIPLHSTATQRLTCWKNHLDYSKAKLWMFVAWERLFIATTRVVECYFIQYIAVVHKPFAQRFFSIQKTSQESTNIRLSFRIKSTAHSLALSLSLTFATKTNSNFWANQEYLLIYDDFSGLLLLYLCVFCFFFISF